MSARAPLVACVAVLGFFAGLTGVRLAWTLAYVLVLLLVVAWAWSWAVARRLHVERRSPDGTHMVGEPFVERFTVRNGSGLPVPWCEVRDGTRIEGYVPGRAFSLAGNGSVTWSARGAFGRRGRWTFGPLEARLGDPFGLFPRRVLLAPLRTVLVYPRIVALGDAVPVVAGTSGRGDGQAGRVVDLPPDVSTVREYATTDGLSRIHWASTAKTGRLMSRVFDTPQSSDVLVLLDLEQGHAAGAAPESTLEYATSIAASISHAALRRGQAVALVCNDAARTAVGAGRGEAHRLRLLEHLADCSDDGTTPLAELIERHGGAWRGRGGIVVITSNRDEDWVSALLDVGTRGRRHLAVVVEPSSFGAPGTPLRIPAAWRLALDVWLVRRGDDLAQPRGRRAATR